MDITPLGDFFEAIQNDARISTTHIGIYAALLQYRLLHGFDNPIQVFSREIMHIAKVSSAMTYHRCIRELSEYGYIRYEPSYNRNKGSRIYFVDKGM
ncbi:hypothetical protein [Parapedobacter sp. SGR-10]|uniref:hypothetical protein n=1 Tax=Parapedobacter sp. SGR-10 TaxID=2710879 RepID=UPI0019804F76|nr:hypothetical protein [Parapedobacter sp. SGR-10]